MPEPKNWKRLALEVVVIVGSILLAFGIEAGWDARQSQGELAESLAALREEFEGHRDLLGMTREINSGHRTGIDLTLGMTPSEVRELSRDSATVLFRHNWFFYPFTPSNAALEAFLSANLLERIPDLELRASIVAWPSVLGLAQGQFAEVNRTGPLIEDRFIELGLAVALTDYRSGGPRFDPNEVLAQLVADDRTRNIVATRYVLLETSDGLMQQVADHVELVLSQLPPGD